MKFFPIKIIVNLKGFNQGVYLKNSEGGIELEKVNQKGAVNTVFRLEKSAWGMLKLWFRQNRKWSMACCVVLVLGFVSYCTIRTFSTPIEERLYNKYYEKMGGEDKNFYIEGNAFDEAKKQYIDGNYTTARIILEGLPDNNYIHVEKAFYHALSLMGEEKYLAAIDEFQKVIGEEGSSPYHHPTAYWYMSLCYTRIGEFDRAETYLYKLNKRNSLNYKKAERLLKRIKKANS